MSAERVNQKKVSYFDPNLQVIFGVTLMSVLGVSSITPAFPRIIEELKIQPQAVGWLITVFTIPGVVLTPVLGVLADRIGRKKILAPSLLLFAFAGFACFFTRDFNVLILFRLLQGIGAAAIGSLNVTILGDLYSGKQRTTALGYNASILNVGTASYPAIGGGLALFGWNYPFLLPLFAIPIGLLVIFTLKSPEPKNEQLLKDYLNNTWKAMKNPQVLVLFLGSTVSFILLYGPFLNYFPILLDRTFHVSTLIIGLILASMSLSNGLVSSQLGRITNRISLQTLLKASYIIFAISLIQFPFLHKTELLLIPSIILGVAMALNVPNILIMIAAYAPIEYRGVFMSSNGMLLRLGQTLGPLIMGIVFEIWGLAAVFYVGTGIALFMFLIVLFAIRDM